MDQWSREAEEYEHRRKKQVWGADEELSFGLVDFELQPVCPGGEVQGAVGCGGQELR